MFKSLHCNNLSRLAVAGTATLVSLAACGEGHRESSINYQSSNSLMNQLTNLIIPLHLSRELYKSNLFMQNEPNFKIDQINTSTCKTNGYGNFLTFFLRKNEPKRTQNEPNFGPKLASFYGKIFAFANKCDELKPPRRLSGVNCYLPIIETFVLRTKLKILILRDGLDILPVNEALRPFDELM